VTERGLPLADGASACPFVAFEDDRDERASVPDHRHRCYAEAQPAPRALAHQEAYCLSSAFPVCPTFQDWARREAARARAGAPSPPRRSDADEREDAAAAGLAMAAAAAAEIAGPDDPDGPGRQAPADPAPDSRAADAQRGDADDEAPDDGDHDHSDSGGDIVHRNPPRDWAAPPPWLASSEVRRGADDADPPGFLGRRGQPGQGLAGSPADRLAGGPPPSRRDEADEAAWVSSAADIEEMDEEPPPRRPVRRPRAYDQHLGGPDGPDWERPRRYEAYPSIRTRVGLPSVPRLAVTAAAVAVAALALFFLPGILNLGGSETPAGSARPSASAVPASLEPTAPPAATPSVYTIKKGDTLSKIAAAHGVTIEDLMAANPTIKDPNKIALGQQIVIPTPSDAPPNEVGGSPAASAAAP
jgi:nucleoid-associated protein YgaU